MGFLYPLDSVTTLEISSSSPPSTPDDQNNCCASSFAITEKANIVTDKIEHDVPSSILVVFPAFSPFKSSFEVILDLVRLMDKRRLWSCITMKLFKSRQQRRFWRLRNERRKLIIFLTWKRFSTLQRRFLSKAPKGPDKTQETMENHATLVKT